VDRNDALELGVLEEGQKVKPGGMPEAGLGEEVAMRDVSDETLRLWAAEKDRINRGGKELTVAERLAALGVPASDFISLTPAANSDLQGRCRAVAELLNEGDAG
jgi:hypothetical protein